MKRGMANSNAFIMCLSPLYLTRPNCLRELMWAMDMCAADKTKKLCVLPMHPSVSFAGCRAIVELASAGCAAQVILPADDRNSKQTPTRLQELKAHKLSDAAVSLLQRLTGPENVGINAEWLKLQPWTSDAEGENWEETSQPWAGPSEGKCVELQQLLDGLCVDVQAAVLAAGPAHPFSAFTNVEDRELQSQPPSQDYLTPSDLGVLRSAFPQLLLNFREADAVRLMLLGLRDSHVVGCIEHGLKRESSAVASQLHPVDAVFRMAADMSACFSAPRAIQGVYVKTKSRTFPTFTKQCRSLCYCVLFRIMRGTRRVTFSSAGSSASARRASSGSKRRAAEVEARSAEPLRGPMFGALCAWGSGAGALRHGLRHVGCDC
jgi:hypothetical protein